MTSSRRTLLVSGGAIAASTFVGASAFSSTGAERSVAVAVDIDTDAYLGLEPASPFATLVDGRLELPIDETIEGVPGDGINTDSEYVFVEAFELINQGRETVTLEVDVDDPDPDPGSEPIEMTFFAEREQREPLEESDPLESGDAVGVTVEVVVGDVDHERYELPVTIHANS